MQRAINTTQIIHEFWIHSLGKSLNKLLSSIGNVNCLTFVAPRLIVVTDAEAATVIFSEESAWCRMLQSNVTEDMIIWRIERIPLRASNKCFWSTLTKSLNRGGGGRGHISLTEVDKWVLIRSRSLISVFSKESNIHAVLPGDTE